MNQREPFMKAKGSGRAASLSAQVIEVSLSTIETGVSSVWI
ncbi:hypothetical protein N9383_00450 [Granulosicoccus sp.]|nr:hypothetical protein [Granulosicoccus sp.]